MIHKVLTFNRLQYMHLVGTGVALICEQINEEMKV